MADEKRAGPWVLVREDGCVQGDWVRSGPDADMDVARVWQTNGRWWYLPASSGVSVEAPTPEAARQAADDALRAAGWELE